MSGVLGTSGDGVTVSGGAGGVAAQVEELDRAAAVLDRVAVHVVRAELARHDVSVQVATHHGSMPALAALRGLRGPRGLHAASTAAGLLAQRLRATADGYLQADRDAAAGMRAVLVAAGSTWGDLGPPAWLAALGVAAHGFGMLVALRAWRWTPTPLGAALRWLGTDGTRLSGGWGATGRLLAGPGLLPAMPSPDRTAGDLAAAGLGAFVVGALPGRRPIPADPASAGAGVLSTAVTLVTPDSSLSVTPVGLSTGPPPRDEGDVLALVADQYTQSTDDAGQVAVQRLMHADGSVSWVVAVPGTQTGGLGGPNPFDPLSDLEAAARQQADATELVIRAMQSAGIGADEPVLVAGHSLGGMVAMEVAATGDYQVTAVLTAGSPVAGIPLPAPTTALHLEHVQDPVPGLAGAVNPDTVNRTTVVRDLPASPGESGAAGVAAAHALIAYRQTAELLPATDPSVIGFRGALDRVLGDDVVGATTWTFTGTRVPTG